MKSERFMDALTGIDERYLSETLQRLETPKPVRPRRRLTQSLLLAAVLILLLAPAAWAAYSRYMSARVPEGALHVYTYDDFNREHDFELPDVAMVINVDTEPEATDIVMRFGWLPEDAPMPGESGDEIDSFFNMLDFFKDHELWPGWESRSLDEMLELAGMTAEEARTWYCGYSWENENRALLHVCVMDAAGLYQRDLLLGMYGGEARVVAEGTRGKYQMLEVQVDYTEHYRKLAEERGFDPPESDLLSDFLLLFEPEEQYLIHLGGSHSDYPFETLEKIADHLELKVTDFPTRPTTRQSYLILDLGRG